MTTKSKKAKTPVTVPVPAPEPEPITSVAPLIPEVEVRSLTLGDSFRLSTSLFRRERTVGDTVLVAELLGGSVVNRYFIPADTKVVKL